MPEAFSEYPKRGPLQLIRLPKAETFQCFRCGQRKTAKLRAGKQVVEDLSKEPSSVAIFNGRVSKDYVRRSSWSYASLPAAALSRSAGSLPWLRTGLSDRESGILP